MTDHFARPVGAASSERVAELHRLCDEDYIKGQQQRATPHLSPSYAALSLAGLGPTPEPSDLDVAISVAQQLLDSDSVLSLREALRLLLRALDAEPVDEPDFVSHENGLTFKVIPADSPFARIARSVRQLEMADGTVWTVGAPIGWHGGGAAWRPQKTEAAPPDAPTPCTEPLTEEEAVRRSVDAQFPAVSAFLKEGEAGQ